MDLEAGAMSDLNASDMRVRQFDMTMFDQTVAGGQRIEVFKNYEAHVYVGLGRKDADPKDTKAAMEGVYKFDSKKMPFDTKNMARVNHVAVFDSSDPNALTGKKEPDGYFQAVDAGGFAALPGAKAEAGHYAYSLKSFTSARTDIELAYEQRDIDPVATAEKVIRVMREREEKKLADENALAKKAGGGWFARTFAKTKSFIDEDDDAAIPPECKIGLHKYYYRVFSEEMKFTPKPKGMSLAALTHKPQPLYKMPEDQDWKDPGNPENPFAEERDKKGNFTWASRFARRLLTYTVPE
jgi:hypothetical protein